MKPFSLFLVLSLSIPAFAEDPDKAIEATSGIVMLPNGDSEEVGKGCWLPEKKCMAMAKALEAKQESNVTLIVVVGVVAAAIGFGVSRLVK